MQGSLARKLRVLRAERGLTLRQAAEQAGVRPGTLSELERGLHRPHDITLSRVAKGYGVPVEDLLEEPVLAGPKAKAPSEAGQWGREAHGLAPYATPEERRAVLNEVGRVVQYAVGRAEYWEQELERGRTTQYAKASSAENLAIQATDEFSSLHRLLGEEVAPGLDAQIERGLASDIADEYVALMEDVFTDRLIQTQHALFDHAARVAETLAQQDTLAKRRERADRSVRIRSRSTNSA
jgi:transcriptional regulator with XRE-family HTH domain